MKPSRNLLLAGTAAAAAGFAGALLLRRPPMDLMGKVVLITGGSRGLGLLLAQGFARQGARIVICARREDELRAAKDELAKITSDVLTVVCDVSDPQQVEGVVDAAIREYGHLDVLVNNAGVIQVGPADSMTLADFEQAMNIMFWGSVYMTLAALPHIRQRAEGRIVNITSVGAKVSVPHLLPYCCAKFACAAFSEGLAAELQSTGVRVVTIAPGLMRTGSYVQALFKGKKKREAAWFSLSASTPGLAMKATRAADLIIQATRTGQAEKILGLPANILARFHGLFPGLTVEILGLANRLLPASDGQTITLPPASALPTRPGLPTS